jgi:hypothetical protein
MRPCESLKGVTVPQYCVPCHSSRWTATNIDLTDNRTREIICSLFGNLGLSNKEVSNCPAELKIEHAKLSG